MLTTLNFNSLRAFEKQMPCGDTSHMQPIFFPMKCHHPHKVLVADLDLGMGTLVHAGSKRNADFGLWPLSQALVLAVREEMAGQVRKHERKGDGFEEEEEREQESEHAEEMRATSLSAFLGEGNDDTDWEVVEVPPVVKEKFVLVGKRDVPDTCVGLTTPPRKALEGWKVEPGSKAFTN